MEMTKPDASSCPTWAQKASNQSHVFSVRTTVQSMIDSRSSMGQCSFHRCVTVPRSPFLLAWLQTRSSTSTPSVSNVCPRTIEWLAISVTNHGAMVPPFKLGPCTSMMLLPVCHAVKCALVARAVSSRWWIWSRVACRLSVSILRCAVVAIVIAKTFTFANLLTRLLLLKNS